MNEEQKEQVNTNTDGLSQDKIEDLFRRLDEAYVESLLQKAGLSEDDLAAAENASEDSGPVNEVPAAESFTADEAEAAVENPAAEISDENAAADEAETAVKAFAGGQLEPEHISHLLKVLGEDMVADMLQDAGLSNDDLNDIDLTPVDSPGSVAADRSDTGDEKIIPAKRRPASRKGRRTRRFLLLAIFVGIILLVFAVNQISMNVTLNSSDPIQYSETKDDISALEGTLRVNDVSVSVPTDGSEEYSISYVWAEDDDKYPSVPQAITAVYSGEEGENLYTISLYRSETINKKSIPKGKKASNWFDSWEIVTEGDVLQKPLKSDNINGFYIYPQMNEDGTGTTSDYNDYSYYFTMKEKSGISIYVIEGVCIDPESTAVFTGIMDECIKSIKVKKETPEPETQQA